MRNRRRGLTLQQRRTWAIGAAAAVAAGGAFMVELGRVWHRGSAPLPAEIDDVLAAAGLADVVRAVVSVEDVESSKPAPDPYLRALALLDVGVRAGDVVAFEDTDAGITSAKAAGVRCLAVLGTLPRERLAAADEIVAAIDVALVRRLLG